jgi:hypothetical protein
VGEAREREKDREREIDEETVTMEGGEGIDHEIGRKRSEEESGPGGNRTCFILLSHFCHTDNDEVPGCVSNLFQTFFILLFI